VFEDDGTLDEGEGEDEGERTETDDARVPGTEAATTNAEIAQERRHQRES